MRVTDDPAAGSRALGRAGVWLGLSVGGFFDGIVLHQILQWHHLLTSHPDPAVRGNLDLNTLADGLFHAACWIFGAIGLAALWRARGAFGAARGPRGFVGSILVGFGVFNLVEGIVNHHLLGFHHVRTDTAHVLAWDLGFLVLGLVLVAVGSALRRPRIADAPA